MWSEEVRARLALPVDQWWSLMVKRAFDAKSSEAYQIKLDVDAALGELERLRNQRDNFRDALVARHGGEPVALLQELDDARAEVERLRGEHGKARNEDAIILTDYRNASHAAIARAEKAEAEVELLRALVEGSVGWRTAKEQSARAERAEAAHLDLVMQVARKFPGETRHDTAKRYIVEREARASEAGSDSAALAGEGK